MTSAVVGVLADASVEVILIGGLAAQAHGSARLTQDVAAGPPVSVRSGDVIRVKRAAGRPKDLEVVAELEALLVEKEREG